MKPFSPAIARLSAALLVVSGVGLLIAALLRPRVPMQPLPDAQLAGSRTIVLEDERPVYGFDDERLPIVVVPPTKGRWSASAVGVGERWPLEVIAEPVDERVRLRVQGPLPNGRLTLVVEDGTRLASWPVQLAAPPTPSEAIERLKAAAADQPVEGRAAVWRSGATKLAGRDQVAAHVEEARAWIAAGDLKAAAAAYERAAEDAGALGWVSEQAGRLRAAAWANLRLRRFAAAHALLDRAETTSRGLDAWALARLDYLRGSVFRKTGLFRRSAVRLQRSWDAARSFDDQRLVNIIAEELGSLLSELGRHREALALLDDTPADGEARGRRLAIRNWIATQASRTDHTLRPRIRAELEECIELPVSPDLRLIALTNLIELELQDRRLDAVEMKLRKAQSIPGEYARRHIELFSGQLALLKGEHGSAREIFTRIEAATAQTLDDELRWQTALGLFHVADAQGDEAAAARWLDAAFQAVEARIRQTAVSDAKATSLADRRSLVEAAVSFHLRHGEPERSLRVLDATRAWVLRDLEARLRVERLEGAARTRWLSAQARYQAIREDFDDAVRRCDRQPADTRAVCRARLVGHRKQVEAAFDALYAVLDEDAPAAMTDARLPTLAAGQALFTVSRIGSLYVAFWLEGSTVRAETVDASAPIAPFSARLDEIDHLYLVPGAGLELSGILARLPTFRTDGRLTWSELPFAGLLTSPYISANGPPVVIADPTSDLQHARAEGAAVHARVGGRLLVGDAVSRQATLSALGTGARVVHFAGHGALDAESPWQAHLVLADGERLTLADLLVAQPKVGVVILSGCETGVRSELSTEYRVGLPDAFLLAGARAVIATNRVVPDVDARAFVDLFYQSPDWAERPAAAFAAAVRKMRAAGNPIWSAFRLMGRA